MAFFEKEKQARGIYGEATLGQRPWWARPFAFPSSQNLLGYLATVLLMYSVWYGFYTENCRNFKSPTAAQVNSGKAEPSAGPSLPASDEKQLTHVGFQKAALIIFWVLVPPIWFWLEYHGLWRYEDKKLRIECEELRLGQELSAKIWLAAVTALGIFYFGKDIRGGA